MKGRLLCITLLSIFGLHATTVQSEGCAKVFVASSEWKQVQPDECLPPGLHYRLNLATGYKEAKLIDAEDDNSHKDVAISLSSVHSEDNNNNEVLHHKPEKNGIPLKFRDCLLNGSAGDIVANLSSLEDVSFALTKPLVD
jgi:hypothetical protein